VKVMKAYAFLSGVLLMSSVVVNAQETAPTSQFEVGFNYGFTRVNPGGTAADFTQNGGSGYVEYNVNRVVGLVADLGATTMETSTISKSTTPRSPTCSGLASTGE
jgi:hypothetical protein